MPDDVIRWNSLQQCELCACLEVVNLVFDLSNQVQVPRVVLQLHVNVEVVRNLPQRVGYKQHLILLNEFLQVNLARVSHEERHSTLVINALQIDLAVHHAVSPMAPKETAASFVASFDLLINLDDKGEKCCDYYLHNA